MIDAQIKDYKLFLDIDRSLYSDEVISKVCYWLTESHTVYRENRSDNIHRLVVEFGNERVGETYLTDLKYKISQSLADFKLREIVIQETKDIRNILYIKAFANNDEFEDYNLDF